MKDDRKLKKFYNYYLNFHSKSKNYIYYSCSFKKCTGKFREDIYSGKVKPFKCHSGLCYNNQKKELTGFSNADRLIRKDKITINSIMIFGLKKTNNSL